MADVDRAFRNQMCGGIVIGRIKVFCLSYADDIVLLSDQPNELQEMLRVLKRYSDRKNLEVNIEKSKVMRFSKSGRKTQHRWKYGGAEIEEIRSFKYLGFTLQSTGKHKQHIDALLANGKRRLCETWSVGERKFTGNFVIRKQLFSSLVEPVITYGSEVFRYNYYDDLEKLQRRYFKWTLGVGAYTKNDPVMEEAQLQTLHWKTAASAMRYEQRATMSPCQLLRECCRLIHSGETNEFTTARRKYCEAAGYSDTLVSRTIAEGGSAWETLKQRRREVLQQMLDCRIRDSRYARIRTLNRLPDYLSRGHNNNMKLISRFRLGKRRTGVTTLEIGYQMQNIIPLLIAVESRRNKPVVLIKSSTVECLLLP